MSHNAVTSAFGTSSQTERKSRRSAKSRKSRGQRRLQLEQLEGRWLLHGGLDWQPFDDPNPDLVNVRLTALLTPSAADTATAVPTSLTHVDQNSQFHLEVWAQDISSSSNGGIGGGHVTLTDTAQASQALALDHSDLFNLFPSGAISADGWQVQSFGGGTLGEKVGEDYLPVGIAPNWARLGSVQYQVTGTGQIDIESTLGQFEFSIWGVGSIPNARVDYGSLSLTINAEPISVVVPEVTIASHPTAPVSGFQSYRNQASTS